VQPVASGDAALAAIASGQPQMVITDWEMPGMDGIALCRALRATRLGRSLYVIMYTSHGEDSELIAGIEAGADDFMVKSADSDVLLARVRAGARASRHTGGIASEFRDARHVAVELAAGAGQIDSVMHGA
jgi:DNA-binding response OmpR family regulator